jgi:TPR repeat protein
MVDADRRRDAGGGSSKAIGLIFALLVIGAAAAAGWYFLYGPGAKPQEQAAPAPAPAPAPTPAPTPAPQPPAAAWPEGTDALTLQELVARSPNVQGIFSAALRRQAAGRHDDALVLLEEAAEKGHTPALTALARLYDPVGFEAGKPFRSPDPRAAARYYRDAVQKGDAAAEPRRAALKTWLEGEAARNPTAADALKEFWP